MRNHFKPKEQGWTTQQDDEWKEKLTEVIKDKYLSLVIVESDVFREMVGTINTNAKIPSHTGISE